MSLFLRYAPAQRQTARRRHAAALLTESTSFSSAALFLALLLTALIPSASLPLDGDDWRTAVPSNLRMVWPLPGSALEPLRGFESPEHRYGSGHRGIDIALSPGSKILTPSDGVIHFAGWLVNRPVVSIRHANGLLSSFEPVRSLLPAGAEVTAGQHIGYHDEGDESFQHCLTPCVHFGVRLHGEYLNPLVFFQLEPLSVLYPLKTPVLLGTGG